jgi:arabinogalactan endo-1,4-beta-galactosidase
MKRCTELRRALRVLKEYKQMSRKVVAPVLDIALLAVFLLPALTPLPVSAYPSVILAPIQVPCLDQTQKCSPTPRLTPIPVTAATLSDSPSDSFEGTILDTFKWDTSFCYGDGQICQDNELVASISANCSFSAAKVFSQSQLLGDFDIQIDFRAGTGWTGPITPSGTNPHIDAAAMGIYVDDPHWINIARMRGPTFDIIGVYSNIPGQGMLAQVDSVSLSGKFRIVRSGTVITYKYDTGTGWCDLYTGVAFATPVLVYLYSGSVATNHAFTTYFDNFLVNSGPTSYTPLVWSDEFQHRPDFRVGGVVDAYLAGQVWGGKWSGLDPLQTMADNGFQWVRVGVLTTSSQYLRETPPSEWGTLPWRDEYWSSLEYTEQILKEASNRGYHLNLFFYLSDKGAHGERQDAPAEWAGLSVTETASALETYTYNTTRYYKDRGLNIELYDIGNEIDCGILNFRPGERIDLPSGVDVNTNMDYMKNNVWKTEAILLKSAISGVKQADPDAKIVLHIARLGISPGDLFVKSFFETMVAEGVDFDFAGLSLPYPYAGWALPQYSSLSWFQRLQQTIDFIASLGKGVIFSEGAYPHDSSGIEGDPMADYPYSPVGQAAWVHDQLRFDSNNDYVAGLFYFYPDWFPGMSTDATTLNLQSSGLFASETEIEPAMEELQANLYLPYVTITSVVPQEGDQGDTLDTVITGTNFTGASSLSLGSGISVNSFTVDSCTQIAANITISSLATPGARDVSVITPGGTVTLSGGFMVNQAPPAITSISPNQSVQGQTLSVSINGSYFTGATSVSFGSGITVNSPFNVNSDNQITASITISDSATVGARDVLVTTPGGTDTLPGGFTVGESKEGLPFWIWIAIGLGVVLVVGAAIGYRVTRRRA